MKKLIIFSVLLSNLATLLLFPPPVLSKPCCHPGAQPAQFSSKEVKCLLPYEDKEGNFYESNICSSTETCHFSSNTCIPNSATAIQSGGSTGGQGVESPASWLQKINPGPGIFAPSAVSIANNLIPFLIQGALFTAIILSLVFLIVGGIMWITGGGNKESLTKAKSTVTYALVGLALALSSLIILNILQTFFLGQPLPPETTKRSKSF